MFDFILFFLTILSQASYFTFTLHLFVISQSWNIEISMTVNFEKKFACPVIKSLTG